MSRYKVCVYAVCKDEEQFVDRFMVNLKEADMVIIGDTGSTDNTVQKFKDTGAIVYEMPIKPWRFDKARNELLKFIPEDVDICVALDVDEIINAGWRDALEDVWQPSSCLGRYQYIWSFNPDGSPAVQFVQHRIHARKNYHWIYPTHEILEYTGKGCQEDVFISGLVVEHYPDKTKDRSFNVSLLELAMQEFPDDVRNLHYLGREYMFVNRYDDAIETFKKYLDHPRSNWNEERSATMRFIGRCYNGKGEYLQAKAWMLKAIAEIPYIRDSYIELAFLAYGEKDWNTVYYAVTDALKIKDKNILGYPSDPRAWNSDIYDIGSIACFHIGLVDNAIEFAKIAFRLSPEDARIQNNISFMEKEKELQQERDWEAVNQRKETKDIQEV
ncbi:tetratricopeptide repeat-containing glycosyltransferase [Lachnoclostridium phytofermentans]|uniref:tetratricopeptide repeat-containing glycosyltransferase n=1 Tax=Lachnoclostridium phytofermentans TaxID=66219 RepID=UPI00068EBA02|nr:glycosyl transferase family 2 [Lachnoclostridium phytofermentans]